MTKRVRVGEVLVVAEVGGGAHPVDVRAGAEAPPLAAEDHGACPADVDERLGELPDQRGVEGVPDLGLREGDVQEVAFALDPQPGHGSGS